MKNLYTILFLTISFNVLSQDKTDNSSINFERKPSQIAYNNEAEMVNHLNNYKSQTYKYYIKLDSASKDKVYQNHIRHSEKNITNIILELYLEKT